MYVPRHGNRRRSTKALLHGSDSPVRASHSHKLHVLVRIDAEMLEDHPTGDIRASTDFGDSESFSFQLLYRPKFRPRDQDKGGSWEVAGHDLDRQTLNCGSNGKCEPG